jgi:Heme oxygenase
MKSFKNTISKREHPTLLPTTMSISTATKPAVLTTEPFDSVASKGRENGLFRSCMKAIRSAHFQSNRMRAVIVLAGLFTDLRIYRDVIAIFYAITKEMEDKLLELQAKDPNDSICGKLLALGYRFTDDYEKDLAYLYSKEKNAAADWKSEVQVLLRQTPAASAYRERIRAMTSGAQVAGAVFCVWGGLVIGGGAVAMPRVKANYGIEATHLYSSVTGPGREERKRAFVQAWDDLTEQASTDDDFATIVQSSRECMQCNNDVFSSLIRNPWWLSPLVVTSVVVAVAAVSVAAWRRLR